MQITVQVWAVARNFILLQRHTRLFFSKQLIFVTEKWWVLRGTESAERTPMWNDHPSNGELGVASWICLKCDTLGIMKGALIFFDIWVLITSARSRVSAESFDKCQFWQSKRTLSARRGASRGFGSTFSAFYVSMSLLGEYNNITMIIIIIIIIKKS